MPKSKTQTASVLLPKESEKGSCVLYRDKKATHVTTNVYLLNATYEKLGKPDAIMVSVEAG